MGWGLANMWYDKLAEIPQRGSPLETILVLVHLHRAQAQLLSTRALVQSLVGLHESKKTQDPAISAFKDYCDQMFPFYERAANADKDQAHQRLLEFVKHRARLDLKPHYKQLAEHAKRMATLKRFRMAPKMPGER